MSIKPRRKSGLLAASSVAAIGLAITMPSATPAAAATFFFPYALTSTLPGGTQAVTIQVDGSRGDCHTIPATSRPRVVPLTDKRVTASDEVAVVAFGNTSCSLAAQTGSQVYIMPSPLQHNCDEIEFAVTSKFWQFGC
ncbi:hypothetical protein ACH470_15990 [Streptomyces bottropensis]|uniref:hypothetical protein n=1 Tax=Streptomyces bottropensis TaxID=42235 RepID=UPI0037B23398